MKNFLSSDYIGNRFAPSRRETIPVSVGPSVIGGGAPILVQSMTNTPTQDVSKTVNQCIRLAKAGCELIRITVPSVKDAAALAHIVKAVRRAGFSVPFSADVHYQPRAAFEAMKWVEKIRINPGNFAEDNHSPGRIIDDDFFLAGQERVEKRFTPLVRSLKADKKALRIGVNHGSLSQRMIYKYGDTVEGMVESALEYLRICQKEEYHQIVFSLKASNARVVIQAYRMLAMRLHTGGHLPYPFHLGVTEAGLGSDGRLKSAVGIGCLLLDGLGDTIRVSLTEDPVNEIPAAKTLIETCSKIDKFPVQSVISENIDYYHFKRRESDVVKLGPIVVGGLNSIAVGVPYKNDLEKLPPLRPLEWISGGQKADVAASVAVCGHSTSAHWRLVRASDVKNVTPNPDQFLEIVLDDIGRLSSLSLKDMCDVRFLWSFKYSDKMVSNYRYLAAWLHEQKRRDVIVLRADCKADDVETSRVGAMIGSLLSDGIGDMLFIDHENGSQASLNLAYDILQAAGARRTKPEYISCPGCGRTLFDLETATIRVKELTQHLGDVAIAVMGCIVNGPGEMADADFGYIGAGRKKVNLYVGRECVRKNIPEDRAPGVLIELIKQHGKWRNFSGSDQAVSKNKQ